MQLFDSCIIDVCGCDMQSPVCVHAWCMYILPGVLDCLLFAIVMSRCLPAVHLQLALDQAFSELVEIPLL